MSAEKKPGLQEGRIRLIRNTISRVPPVLLMAVLTYPASFLLSNIPKEDYAIYGALIGAIVYAVGTEVDNQSTIFGCDAINRFEMLTGIRSPIIEVNTDLPARPTAEDIYSRVERIKHAVLCVSSILLPPIGVSIGALRLLGSLNNLLEKRFHERKLTEYLNR